MIPVACATRIVERRFLPVGSLRGVELKDRIKLSRVFAKLSQTGLAEACGWPWGSRVGNYEQGTNEPSLEDLGLIAKACSVSEAWLATGEGTMAGFLRPISVWNDRTDLPAASTMFLPKLDYLLSAGKGGPDPSAVEQSDKTMPFDAAWAKAEGWAPATHYTMRASGESMEPTIQHNAPVVIDTSAKTIRTGLVYAVLIDGEPLLKRLDKLPGGRVRVRSDNPSPAYAPYEVDGTEIQLIGRAVWTPTRL